MRLCACTAPLRSTAILDRTRCLRCAGWTAHGRMTDPDRVKLLAGDARSLLARLADDYPYAFDLAHSPTRRPQNGRSGSRPDPTGNAVADECRARIRTYTLIVDRLLERVVRDIRSADEASGDALLAAEGPGPAEHTKAAFHDSSPRLIGRPDLDDAYAAQDRRRARGEAL
jgi:hypothetical protein